MGIVIGKIELESKKQVVCELRKKIKGINLNTAKRIIMLSGNLERLTGKNLLKSQEKQIVEIIQTFKGLYEYTFGLKEEEFEKIRRIENAYKYIRVRKGYPVRGRTKSNANTAGKKVKKENSKLAKNVDVLKKKPTNRKERKLYNKIKKLQEKHNKQQKKIQDGKKKIADNIRVEMMLEKVERIDLIFCKYVEYRFPIYILKKLWLYKFIRRKYDLIGPLNNQILSPYLKFNLFFDESKARRETLKVYIRKVLFVLGHILYLSCIAYYDSFLYEKVMYDWLEEIMRTRY